MSNTTGTAAGVAEGDRSVSRRRLLRTTAAGAVAGVVGYGPTTATATAQDGGPVPAGPTIGLEPVAEGFAMPTDFATPPGDDRRFVVDRPGQLYVVGTDGRREEPFLDISDRMAPVTGEMGLLGIAFHPAFGENGRFYLRYSAPPTDETPDSYSHTAVLAEFRANGDRTAARPDSERRLLEVPEPQSNHNAGAISFGPDGYLYVPFGDGGAANDVGIGHVPDWYDANEGGNGQDVTENFLGSILRIDVDSRTGNKPYGIPDDNPLVGEDGLDEQFAWGFRNPWRIGFSNGTLYAGDVGQNRYEEVDRVVKGGNYGWNVKEGTHCFSTGDELAECPDSTPQNVRGGEPLRDPVIEYPHTHNGETIGISVIGGYIYENEAVPSLQGKYVFGDYSQGGPQGSLFAATPSEGGLWRFAKLEIAGADDGELGGYLLDVGRDDAGELYALTAGGDLGGAVYKLVSAGGPSGTGANATQAASGTAEATDGSAETDTATETTPGTEANGTGAVGADAETGTSTGAGPGFGVIAVLSGLASVVAYLLAGDE